MRGVLAAFAFVAAQFVFGVTVEVDESNAEMGVVTWSQAGASYGLATLSLSAKAAPGFSFSGWLVDGLTPEWDADPRNPSLSGVAVPTNSVVSATFIDVSEDTLSFDFADDFAEFEYGVPVSIPLDIDSVSYPSLTFRNLPVGLSYDARTHIVSGTPRAPCLNRVTVSGVNGSGYRFVQVFDSSVGDVSSDRMSGSSAEIPVGAYYHVAFDDLFNCTAERMTTRLAGLPPGLEWNESWGLLFGTPTDVGTYVIIATVRFADGISETASVRLTVESPDPDWYEVDFVGLEELSVGDVLVTGDVELGYYSGGSGIVSVSGLPPGLSVEARNDGDMRIYGVVGIVRTAGIFPVSVGVADVGESGTTTVVTVRRDVSVRDTPWRYLRVGIADSSPSGSGTVSGGGVLSSASGANVTASPAKGYVFAGWLNSIGDIADVGEGVDYRSPSISFGADEDLDFIELFAEFAPAEEDVSVSIEGLDGDSFYFASDTEVSIPFSVVSVSLPSVTAKGLPDGVTVISGADGAYQLAYDPATAARRLAPGRYTVELAARNVSGASGSATILLTVSNISDERIDIEDDYGEFTPGEEIDPIDLSDAVDFSRGETISVSGLPRGLVFNRTAKDSAGVAANTITGTPTVPGYYTLTFTAKVVASERTDSNGRVTYVYEQAVATAFITVLPYPLLSVAVDDEAAAFGNTVSGGGNYKSGTKVTLKAKSAKGWVFAGWDGIWDVEWPESLRPSLSLVTEDSDLDVTALFMPVSDDWLTIFAPVSFGTDFDAELDLGVDVTESGYGDFIYGIVDSGSYPTVKVSGLPSGVKFSASTLLLSGKPTKPGIYDVTVSAKNAGGYTFTRILRIAVRDADGNAPAVAEPENGAEVDSSALDELVTGTYYGEGAVTVEIGPNPDTGAEPEKVSVSGVPNGLKASVAKTEGGLSVGFIGTPTKVARFALALKVTYADRSTRTSKAVVTTTDGGSGYVGVTSSDESLGTVSGSGVYAAGATVKLTAKPKSKCVFAGWTTDAGEGAERFAPLEDIDGIDGRTPSVSFPYRPAHFADGKSLVASFAPSADDSAVAVDLEDSVWNIFPEDESEFAFSVDSLSLPKITAKNLPKGVTVDLARGRLVYTPTASVKSGKYAASLTAQNQSKAKGSVSLEIRVANFVCDAIGGLDPDMDAYNVLDGVAVLPDFARCMVEEGWTVKASGLPSGLKFDAKTGAITGVSTAKAGAYTVTFTASKKGEKSQVATITLNVETLPDWAVGTFNGAVWREGSDEAQQPAGVVQSLTVAANGKISGKVLVDGLTYVLSAWSFETVGEWRIPYDNGHVGEYEGLWKPGDRGRSFGAMLTGKIDKSIVTNYVEITETRFADAESESGYRTRGVATSGDGNWTAWQNLWKTEPWKTTAKQFSKAPAKQIDVENGILTLKFANSGAVTAVGKFVTGTDSRGRDIVYSASCSSVLLPVTEGDGSLSTDNYAVFLYFPPKAGKFDGFAVKLALFFYAGDFHSGDWHENFDYGCVIEILDYGDIGQIPPDDEDDEFWFGAGAEESAIDEETIRKWIEDNKISD